VNVGLDLVALVVVIVAGAVAWGDLRQQVKQNREEAAENRAMTDRYHHENAAKLDRIETDVKRINGSVREHEANIRHQSREIDRLRGAN